MFVLKSRTGLEFRARDPGSGEMKAVHMQWVVFDELPHGLTLSGDPTCMVREILCDADLESVLAENAREAGGKPAVEPVVESVAEVEPPKRRGRPPKMSE